MRRDGIVNVSLKIHFKHSTATINNNYNNSNNNKQKIQTIVFFTLNIIFDFETIECFA